MDPDTVFLFPRLQIKQIFKFSSRLLLTQRIYDMCIYIIVYVYLNCDDADKINENTLFPLR